MIDRIRRLPRRWFCRFTAPRIAPILAVCALAIQPQSAHAQAEPYRLNPQDRLMIRVLTYDYRLNSLTGWQGLSGEYGISPEGSLQLPLAGTLQAEGLTQAELSEAISDLLRRRAGLDETPQLSVELMSSLPVYVLGNVEQRGAVEYRPGMTARQALALAGGMFRAQAANDTVRIVALSGALSEAEGTLRAFETEQARIRGELAELQGDPTAATDAPTPSEKDVQRRLQIADQTARQVRIDSYNDLHVMLQEKGARLTKQLELRDEQIESTREQLAGIESLNERGLAVNARVTSLEASLSELESKRLEIETALLLLDEQLNQAERDRDTITTDAIAERLARLSVLESELAAARIRQSTARAQLQAVLGADTPAPDAETPPEPIFIVTRDGDSREILPNDRLQPGDTLDINLPAIDTAETEQDMMQ
ncbi:exopolysaccharide production protein ExoF [Paracoccus isoporae]|uniref:Exopolysaccharide production protein ExoF n=1 Tax=Paracoccus isoporae TaxID=591205 RepID=A0A1G6UAJ7_9RHOB|nr:polysaccharide biosynthesis/export family protein [Paracoccus isoporae]SDD38412.1 exopolysaccharide production protein ExoF [Paracoccus isoporae]